MTTITRDGDFIRWTDPDDPCGECPRLNMTGGVPREAIAYPREDSGVGWLVDFDYTSDENRESLARLFGGFITFTQTEVTK